MHQGTVVPRATSTLLGRAEMSTQEGNDVRHRKLSSFAAIGSAAVLALGVAACETDDNGDDTVEAPDPAEQDGADLEEGETDPGMGEEDADLDDADDLDGGDDLDDADDGADG